jgi:DNA relaxase NicK
VNKTKLDWLAFRSRGGIEAHQSVFQAVFDGLGQEVRLKPRKGGLLGYKGSAHIMVGDVEAGVHAWGGDNQRGWTMSSITGEGCAWITDLDRAQEAASTLDGYELKRVDIALDTFDGSTSFDKTLEAYRRGGFSPAGSGRPPKCEPMKPEREEDSAIIRIGSRASDKYLRGYEKGKQILGPSIVAAEKRQSEFDHREAWLTVAGTKDVRVIDGEAVCVNLWDWYRLELELKAQTGQLPEDVIDRRDQYFAGAYPYLGEVLPNVDAQAFVMSRERSAQLDLSLALAGIRAQYGSTLFTALTAYQGDIGAVFEKIVGSKHNAALLKAGVLMVDHS